MISGADSGTLRVDGGSGVTGYTWHADVEPIFRNRCQSCHSYPPQYAARYPLVIYEDTQLPGPDGRRMYLHVAERLAGLGRIMPPPSQPQLTSEEHQIIMSWVAGGAPEGIPPATQVTWYQHIEPIFATYCGQCHSDPPTNGAPWSLMNYADLMMDMDGVPRYEIVMYRMSGGGPNAAPMPPPTQPQVPREMVNLVRAWIEDGAPEGTLAPATWWQDVRPILQERCFLCHNDPPDNGGPWPFASYAQVTRMHPTLNRPMYALIAERVAKRTMPPISQPQLRLSDRQIATINRWAAAGAPEGMVAETPDAGVVDSGPPDSGPGIPWADGGTSEPLPPGARWIETYAQNPFTRGMHEVPVEETSYNCWSYLVGSSTLTPGQQYATYFEPIRDNSRDIHHVMLFVDRTGINLDPAVDGPFDCLGFPFNADNSSLADFVAGWFPGRGPQALPDGVGVELAPTDRLIMQMHYESVDRPGTMDFSGFRTMVVSGGRRNPAAQLTHGSIWTTPLRGVESRTAECVLQADVTGFSVVPHMHTYGTRIIFDVQHPGSTTWNTIVEINPWSFDDMPIVDLPPAMQRFRAGDRLRTRCFWNTRGDVVRQGEGGADEMCFNFLYHYPPHPNVSTACAVVQP